MNYFLYRKLRDEKVWSEGLELGSGATSYTDTDVVVGGAYEYWLIKWTLPDYSYAGEGYVFAGVKVPLVESRGKAVILVDNSFTTSLSNELARLEQDLVGDGWAVLRHDVPRMSVDPANTSSSVWAARSNELANTKAVIKAEYDADPLSVKVLFLIGHVPVPYSGNLNPDAHSEHKGAWPADGFYGDMDAVWGDSTVNASSASDPRNRNVPGDGKFDRTIWPINQNNQRELEIQVGRVDFANLPAFALSEAELLRNYLNKDHAFRHQWTQAERRGLIDDNLGYFSGETPAVNGWRDFAAFFGATNTIAGDWLTVPSSQSYLWGYGCGGGTYTSCSGVATAAQLATSDPRIVFAMFFGSYFGDWDSQNNFLRATIATTNYTLTSAWVCRPYWHFHHMGLGETVGFSTRVTQNNDGSLYSANGFQNFVHVALMGDPTLRMHVVGPASNLVATSDPGGVLLTWSPSTDTVLGYHVYRCTNAAGPFTRLNSSLITGTNYVDSQVGTNVYMVRAVKLEVSGSGSYYNASQGIFQTYAPSSLPVLTITALNTNIVYGAPLPALSAQYSGFVGDDGPEDLDAPAVLATTATAGSPVGAYPITVSGAADANYLIQFVAGTLQILPATTTGTVSVSANPALPGQTVTLTATLGVSPPGVGVPTGQVQFAADGEDLGSPVSLSGGIASYTTDSLPHGALHVAARYPGDTNFTGSTNELASPLIINTPPVAGSHLLERIHTNGVKVSIATLLGNDTDSDGDPLHLASVSAASTQGGTVITNQNWIFYLPPAPDPATDTVPYSVSDGIGAAVEGIVTITRRANPGDAPSPNIESVTLEGMDAVVRFSGIPGYTYTIQCATNLTPPVVWTTLGTASAPDSGAGAFTHAGAAATNHFYRTVWP